MAILGPRTGYWRSRLAKPSPEMTRYAEGTGSIARTRFQQFLTSRGKSVSDGVADLALSTEDALFALELASKAGLGILGGDVYHSVDGELHSAYAGWHCERETEESVEHFVERARSAGSVYVRQYPRPQDAIPMFVLVTAEFDD